MEELRHTDAKVYAATHPGVRARGHVNRCNPRLRWKLSRFNPMNKTPVAQVQDQAPSGVPGSPSSEQIHLHEPTQLHPPNPAQPYARRSCGPHHHYGGLLRS